MGETETMLKIFLAEDEIVMREGIRNNIAWQEEGFEFVGEASDGELAYPMIQKLKCFACSIAVTLFPRP